ncbi:MAG: polysaccharide biosynthesis/export family protein [Pseudomonadota bacterium]
MTVRTVAAALAALSLAGCAAAPKGGPTTSAVLQAAEDPATTVLPFAFTPLSPQVVQALETQRIAPPESLTDQPALAAQRLRIGDRVAVTVWEPVEGGLFSGGEASPKGSDLPVQRVAPDGTIRVPYAGDVRAVGRTPSAVSSAVEAALAGKAIDPQVLVTVAGSPVNAVTVIGDGGRSSRVDLADVGERVLDMVASAGGSEVPPHRALVRLTRGDVTAQTHLSRILREPAQNVLVRPGDVVSVIDDGPTFTVLGAANRPSRVNFESESVALDEALGSVGGLDDRLANPGSVYVFRYEEAELVRSLGLEAQAEPLAPIVYNLDLTDPGAFFLARRFDMRDGDILYVANAPLADAQKVLTAVATGLTPVLTTLRLIDDLSN